MSARGYFRHDAAEGAVRLFLSREPMRQDAPIRGDHCRGGFIATGFYAEDDRHAGLPCHRRSG